MMKASSQFCDAGSTLPGHSCNEHRQGRASLTLTPYLTPVKATGRLTLNRLQKYKSLT